MSVSASHDMTLITAYARDGDPAALRQLIERHHDWLRSAAGRMLDDDGRVDEVVQAAFVLLARKSRSLSQRSDFHLGGWLFRVLRYEISALRRTERRRRRHEQAAAQMRQAITRDNAHESADPVNAQAWAEICGILDDAVAALRESERRPVLLRFYERMTFPEVAAVLGTTEEAARKRVDRAVGKLRADLLRRGVTAPSAAGLAALLGTQVVNSSASTAATVAAVASLISTAGAGSTSTVLALATKAATTLAWAKVKAVAIVGLAIAGTFALLVAVTIAGGGASAEVPPPTPKEPDASTSPPAAAPMDAQEGQLVYSGRVLLPDGTPATDASLTVSGLFSDHDPLIVQADAEGYFAFTRQKLPIPDDLQTVNLFVEAPGEALTGAVVTPSVPRRIHIPPRATGRVRLLLPDGRPAAGMLVTLDSVIGSEGTRVPAPYRQRLARRTDEAGVVAFDNLPPSSIYRLQILDDRYADPSVDVSLRSGQDYLPTIQLRQAASISGHARLKGTEQPAKGILVVAMRREGGFPLRDSVTDADGRFHFQRLARGTYSVVIWHDPGQDSPFTGVALTGIEVVEGQHLEDRDIEVTEGVIVSGRVTSATDGAPVPNVQLGLQGPGAPDEALYSPATWTDTHGVYRYRVPPGTQKIVVTDAPSPYRAMERTYRSIDAEPGKSGSLDFTVVKDPIPPLVGRVLDAQGAPVAGAALFATPPDARDGVPILEIEPPPVLEMPKRSTLTDGDGRFRLEGVLPGAYLRVRHGYDAGTPQPLVYEAGAQEVQLTIIPDARRFLHVLAASSAGDPLETAMLTLTPAQEPGIVLKVAAEGKTEFDSLRVDMTYELSATAEGYGRTTTTIRPGLEKVVTRTLTLPRADGVLEGLIVDQTGTALPNMHVEVSGTRTPLRTARTDDEGFFRITSVVSHDRLSIHAMDDRFAAEATAMAGEEVTLTAKPLPD